MGQVTQFGPTLCNFRSCARADGRGCRRAWIRASIARTQRLAASSSVLTAACTAADSSCAPTASHNCLQARACKARAKEISRAFLDDLSIPYEPLKRIDIPFENVDKHHRYICSVCNDRVIIGDIAWQMHQQSRKHKKLKAKSKKL